MDVKNGDSNPLQSLLLQYSEHRVNNVNCLKEKHPDLKSGLINH